MKLRTIIKMAVISSVVLLCTGFIMYSFFKLSAAGDKDDFNLYTLVPTTTTAVLEIGDVGNLVHDINELNCSKDHRFLYTSKLFSVLKTHLYTLSEDAPHGLSRQMNKMLISFHEPNSDLDQVLYCSLGSGDHALIERLIQKYCSSVFPSKMLNYKGEEIRIYPMPDGSFLACYITSRYLVISYQEKLIEKVIDARKSAQSLSNEASFKATHENEKINITATIYVRMQSLNMGKMTDGIRSQASLGGWTEFDVKMNGSDAVYCSGISHDMDTCLTFMNMLRKQQSINGFPGDLLPATTFFFSKRSIANLQAMLDFTLEQEYATATYSDSIKVFDEALTYYLKENGGTEIMTCLFQRNDTAKCPAAIMSLPVINGVQAEQALKKMALSCLPSKKHSLYRIPRSTLFTQLTGITGSELHTYACFYAGRLLFATDAESLTLYMQHMDKGEVFNAIPAYEKEIYGLSNSYHFMLSADLEQMFRQPENYVRLVPSFFFRNFDFFRYFTLSVQFSCADGVVYPNVVLLYKGE